MGTSYFPLTLISIQIGIFSVYNEPNHEKLAYNDIHWIYFLVQFSVEHCSVLTYITWGNLPLNWASNRYAVFNSHHWPYWSPYIWRVPKLEKAILEHSYWPFPFFFPPSLELCCKLQLCLLLHLIDFLYLSLVLLQMKNNFKRLCDCSLLI